MASREAYYNGIRWCRYSKGSVSISIINPIFQGVYILAVLIYLKGKKTGFVSSKIHTFLPLKVNKTEVSILAILLTFSEKQMIFSILTGSQT